MVATEWSWADKMLQEHQWRSQLRSLRVSAKHTSKYYRVIRTADPSTDPDGPI